MPYTMSWGDNDHYDFPYETLLIIAGNFFQWVWWPIQPIFKPFQPIYVLNRFKIRLNWLLNELDFETVTV